MTPRLTDMFSALGDPTRFAIVEQLLSGGEAAAGDLGKQFAISAPAISRHLSVLHDAGLVQRRRDRQRRLYSVEPVAMRQVADWMMSHRAFWDSSLTRLDALMANEEHTHDR